MASRHRYLLTLEVEQSDATAEEATRVLRSALKTLLRSFGLRCTSAAPLPLDRPESPTTHDKGTP